MGLFKRKSKKAEVIYIEKSNHEDIEKLKQELKETKLRIMWAMLSPRQREKLKKMVAQQKSK